MSEIKTVTHAGKVYQIGKRYVFTDSLPLGDDFSVSRLDFIYAPNSDPGYVFDSEGLPYQYAFSLSEVDLDSGTIITPALELVNGNAYMFDYGCIANRVGVYHKEADRFYFAMAHIAASACTDIRLMTVGSE
jgi:hypothetical protein